MSEPELVACFPNCAPKSAMLTIHMDVSTRVSTCHICEKPIPKGLRLIFTQKLRQEIITRNGGRIWQRKTFGHPECVIRDNGRTAAWLAAEKGIKPTERPCWDCGRPADLVQNVFRCFTGKRYSYAHLCPACAAQPCWERCEQCQVYHPTSQVITALSETQSKHRGSTWRGCKQCIENGGYRTLYQENRERRRNERLEDQFEALKAQLLKEHICPEDSPSTMTPCTATSTERQTGFTA